MFYKFLKSEDTLNMIYCLKIYSGNDMIPVEDILQCLWLNSASK